MRCFFEFETHRHISPYGRALGVEQTAKGVPDSYYMEDGKYVFINHTVEKKRIADKVRNDIEKCLSYAKAELTPGILGKIICCHVGREFSCAEDNQLRQHCRQEGIELEIWGAAAMALIIYEKYPQIARDILRLPFQVISSPMEPLYGNRFRFDSGSVGVFGRDSELRALEAFCENDALLCWTGICGKAGIGKSKLAYELCQRMKDRDWNTWEPVDAKYGLDEIKVVLRDGVFRNTLICLDDIKTQEEEIAQFIYSVARTYPRQLHKIRILLMERSSITQLDCLDDIVGYRYRYDEKEQKNIHVNSDGYMELLPLDESFTLQILKDYAARLGKELDVLAGQELLRAWYNIDSDCARPLYALCVADAWCSGENPRHWNREFALQAIVRKEHVRLNAVVSQIFSKESECREYCRAVEFAVLIATFLQRIEFDAVRDLIQGLFQVDTVNCDFLWILSSTGKMPDGTGVLQGVEPDLIGEYYCMDVLNQLKEKELDRFFEYVFASEQFLETIRFFSKMYEDYGPLMETANWYQRITCVTFPSELKYVKKNKFSGCGFLEEIRLHNQVCTIQSFAFYSCTHLKTITFPSSLEEIGSWAFGGCTALVSAMPEDPTGMRPSVLTIGAFAFGDCCSLENIVIPASVNAIGHYAFRNCFSLHKIVVPRKVRKINAGTFDGCSLLEKVEFGAAKIELGQSVFKGCRSLHALVGMRKVVRIEADAFRDCVSLKKLELPNLDLLEEQAFYGCEQLQEADLSKASIQKISQKSFYGCSQLEKVLLPDGVTHIGDWAFCGCSRLEGMTLPQTVERIGRSAFRDCEALSSLVFQSEIPQISVHAITNCPRLYAFSRDFSINKDKEFCGFTFSVITFREISFLTSYMGKEHVDIPDTVIRIGKYAFKGHEKLVSVRIPGSVISIGEAAFARCAALERVDAKHNQIQSIGKQAFSNCRMLVSFEGELNIQSVEPLTFVNCSALERISFGCCLKEEDESAFQGCTSITVSYSGHPVSKTDKAVSKAEADKVKRERFVFDNIGSEEQRFLAEYRRLADMRIPDSCTGFFSSTFIHNRLLKTIVIPEGVRALPRNAFLGCTNLESVKLPKSLQSIGVGCFRHCTALKEIEIPFEVETIGFAAFQECFQLEKVVIPPKVTVIERYTFKSCGSLEKVIILGEVTTIGQSAFYGCTRMEDFDIPKSVSRVDISAFSQCHKLKKINVPSAVSSLPEGMFCGCHSLEKVCIPPHITVIPANCFKNCDLLSDIELPPGLRSIGPGAFRGCKALSLSELPQSLEQLGESAFRDCHSLEEISLPKKIRDITVSAFQGCINLKRVLFDEVDQVCNYAFDQCAQITDIPIDHIRVRIGSWAFQDCTSLQNPGFSETLAKIGIAAFCGCAKISKVTLPPAVKAVPAEAFRDNGNLETVILPASIKRIERSAFEGCTSLRNFKILSNSISLEERVFAGCGNLYHIDISESSMVRIKQSALTDCPAGTYMDTKRWKVEENEA